jgi:hypothetical protein
MDVLTKEDRKRQNAKLTKDDVREIRRLAPYMLLREIAAEFGVSAVQVCHIVNNQQWKDVQ